MSTNKQTVTNFVNQAYERGRNATGSLYYEGNVLYSYGEHWPLAVHHKGELLINGDKYSVTTSRHASLVRCAASKYRELSLEEIKDIVNPL